MAGAGGSAGRGCEAGPSETSTASMAAAPSASAASPASSEMAWRGLFSAVAGAMLAELTLCEPCGVSPLNEGCSVPSRLADCSSSPQEDTAETSSSSAPPSAEEDRAFFFLSFLTLAPSARDARVGGGAFELPAADFLPRPGGGLDMRLGRGEAAAARAGAAALAFPFRRPSQRAKSTLPSLQVQGVKASASPCSTHKNTRDRWTAARARAACMSTRAFCVSHARGMRKNSVRIKIIPQNQSLLCVVWPHAHTARCRGAVVASWLCRV